MQRHVLSDGVLDVVLEFLIEHFALLNGQFAFFQKMRSVESKMHKFFLTVHV